MKTENLKHYLDSFGKNVVREAKLGLKKAKGNTALGQSIRVEVTPTEKGFSTKFYMLDYGTFLDKGVSGSKKKRSFENYKKETVSSPYSYTTKGPPIDILAKWIKKKGIKPKGWGRGRDKDTGRYLSGLAIYISHKIKTRGIKSLSFFQKPLGFYYGQLKENMLKRVRLDMETYITTFYRPK